MNIRHLENKEINLVKWDNCVNTSFNGNTFAFSWYLNILSEDWEAIIVDDYEYVFPLFSKKSSGKKQIYTPLLANRLGLFSNKLLDPDILDQIIDYLSANYNSIDIILNKYNKTGVIDYFKSAKTYDLDLIRTYTDISANYSPVIQKLLSKAEKDKISVVNGLMPNDLIEFALNTKYKFPKLKLKDLNKLRMIISFALRYNIGNVYGAYNRDNTLCAVAFFLESKGNAYLFFNASDHYGFHHNALPVIIDRYIEHQSEKNVTLNIDKIASKDYLDFLHGIGTVENKINQIHFGPTPWFNLKKSKA